MQPEEKINTILLIDDDENDRFIHKRVIKNASIAVNIEEAVNGLEGLKYLMNVNSSKNEENKYSKPDIIFLDMNMPRMDGREFLEAYQTLDDEITDGIFIVMLSTSQSPQEIKHAKSEFKINKFMTKPLDTNGIAELMRTISLEKIKS